MPRRRRRARRQALLSLGIELARGELGPLDQLAQPREELRLERPDRQVPSVCGRVDPVAGEAAREEARERITAQPVRDEAVRAVRHRDRQPGAAAGARALEQCREDLGDRAERACCEVGRLKRRQARRGVFEHARPAEVVQVVTCASRMRPLGSESRDRAVDRASPGRRPGRRRAARPRPAGSLRGSRLRGRAGPVRTAGQPSGRSRPTPCRRSALRPRLGRRHASGRRRAARAARPARRAATARGTRTRPAGSGSCRRRASLRAVAPVPKVALQCGRVD